MRFKLIGQHRAFFNTHGYLELESVLSSDDIRSLSSTTDALMQKRVSSQLEFRSADELYRVGHDLWRDDDIIRKKVFSHSLADLGVDLFKKKTLHIAFDQLLRTGSKPGFPQKLPSSLNEISSIYPLAGAVLIHLSGSPTPSEFIPHQQENVIFLSPSKIIPWELFFQTPHQSYLLIAYATPESVYVLQKNDPHTHALKKLGYAFGDRIKNDKHPILIRGYSRSPIG